MTTVQCQVVKTLRKFFFFYNNNIVRGKMNAHPINRSEKGGGGKGKRKKRFGRKKVLSTYSVNKLLVEGEGERE